MEQDKESLAREIAKQLATLVYSECVNGEGIAYMLGMKPNSTPYRLIVADPSFPRPISLTEGGHKRWSRAAVKAWIQAQFDNDNAIFMRALKAAI